MDDRKRRIFIFRQRELPTPFCCRTYLEMEPRMDCGSILSEKSEQFDRKIRLVESTSMLGTRLYSGPFSPFPYLRQYASRSSFVFRFENMVHISLEIFLSISRPYLNFFHRKLLLKKSVLDVHLRCKKHQFFLYLLHFLHCTEGRCPYIERRQNQPFCSSGGRGELSFEGLHLIFNYVHVSGKIL